MSHAPLRTAFLIAGFFAVGCGGSTEADSGGKGSRVDAGGGADGGSSGGAGGSGGSAAASGGGGMTGGSGGAAGTGGGGVAGGSGEPCIGLDYCDCVSANASCQVFAEDCFCPCGVEPCEPPCDCDCGGGAYLGCGPSSILEPGALEGIWLIGWSGGMNHYSWVRFNADSSADVLAGDDLAINAPYWPCTGAGSWVFGAKPNTVFLMLPAACGTGEPLTFDSLGPGRPFPLGSVLSANINTPPGSPPPPLEGYKFPPSQCDASMTVCQDPF